MNKRNLIIGIIVLITLVGGVVLYVALQSREIIEVKQSNAEKTKEDAKETRKQTQEQKTTKEQANKQNQTDNGELKPEEKIDTSNWKTYRNEELGFEVKYPKSWSVQQNNSKSWKSFHFNKTKCLKYKDDVCDDEFLSVNISDKPDSELRTSSLWSWAISGHCDKHNNDDYGVAHKIPLLRFNIPYSVQTCKFDELGYKWQNYMFTKDNLLWLFVIRYNDKGYDSLVAKTILETFHFTKK